MKSAEVTINDVLVKYIIKPVIEPAFSVVFIHGFPFDKSSWAEQLNVLPGSVQGIAYDVRGLGESEIGHGFSNVNLLAEDLLAFIKALNLKEVIVCGISMGGYIILRAMQLDPSLFKGLILCDTTSEADTNESKLNRFAGIQTLQTKDKEVYADGSIKKLFSSKTHKSKPGVITKIKESIVKNPAASICATLLALASRTDTTDVLEKIKVPVLLIRGAEDMLIKAEQAEDLKSKISGSELVTIDSAGHLPNLENPGQFNQALNGFLKKYFLNAG